MTTLSNVLRFSDRITALPVIHGSADFAVQVRHIMLTHSFDCLAVPLPESFQEDVERAIPLLPTPSVVVQNEERRFRTEWRPDQDDRDNDGESAARHSYVPIDPCQPVIAALRIAMGEHIPRRYIDLEVERYEPLVAVLPDPYALKTVRLDRFAAAILPGIGPLPEGQAQDRVQHMAARLRELEQHYESILVVCNVLDWPWLRHAYRQQSTGTSVPREELPEHEEVEPTELLQVAPQTLIFLFGELPFITGLYERARAELEDDENLSVDGVKELLLASRDAYRHDLKRRARKITPKLLSHCLKYVRNLSLIESRLTPDLYSIVIAAKQVAGDTFALHVAETARDYPYQESHLLETLRMGIDQASLPNGDLTEMLSRLPGEPVTWRSCQLKRRPDKKEVEEWRTRWNPFAQCSWPPEDEKIENFRSHVFDRAKQIMGADLVKTEKFSSSIKDGIDIRDTLRHWYDGDIYVKVMPPVRGDMDCAVMFFDSPADPRDYPWRSTWFAEHDAESTLGFFATNYLDEPVGPGICHATYGGALFLYPPIAIPDVWTNPFLDFAETLEERLLAAGCLHARSKHVALLSPLPPGAGWRRLAKRFGKSLVHVPLTQFSESTIEQLRTVHVLNGREVRSFAADFIRKA